MRGITFTGQTKDGSINISDTCGKNTTNIQLDIQNNIFLGWGTQDITADVLAAGTNGGITGLIAHNYFAREVGRTASLDTTNYPLTYNRAVHMRNANGLVIDSNRFVDYDRNTLYFTTERGWQHTTPGNLDITVQDNRFENCVGTEHRILHIDDNTKASINYFGNYFLRCGYGTGIIYINVTESGLVEKTNFANCSINIQSNKFYECERAIGLHRNNNREYDTTKYSAFGGDISELTFNINQNVFWIPPERQQQSGNCMDNSLPTRFSYNSYNLSCIYFRVANDKKGVVDIPEKWNFGYNTFYAPRWKLAGYRNPYHPSLYINCYMKQNWVNGSPTEGYQAYDETKMASKFLPYFIDHGLTKYSMIDSTSTTVNNTTNITSITNETPDVSVTSPTYVFDGSSHSFDIYKPADVIVSYSYNDPASNGYKSYSATKPSFVNVGTYLVTCRFVHPGKLYKPKYLIATVKITKRPKTDEDDVKANSSLTQYRSAAIANQTVTYQYNTSYTLGDYPTENLLKGDKVSYIYEKKRYDSMPSFTTVGSYTVKIEITNPNCETYTFTPKLTIKPASLSGVTIRGGCAIGNGGCSAANCTCQSEDALAENCQCSTEYNGTVQTIICQSKPTDVQPLYSINGGEFVTTVPSFKDVTDGPVTVTVRLANPNYTAREDEIHVFNITPTYIDGVTVAAKENLVETGDPIELVTVTGTQTNDIVQYALDGGAYSSTVPTALRAGDYTVAVKISRVNCEDLVQVVTVTIAEGETTIPNIFALTLESTEVTANDTGITTFTWQLGFAEAQTETLAVVEQSDFKVLAFGLKYAATLNHLEDYVFYKKYGKETEAQALITAKNVADHPYGEFDGTGIATLYARNNMHISNTNPNKARYAVSYIRFSIDGVEYEEYSPIASASNLPGSDFSDYGDIPTTDGAINESDIFITP